MEKSASLKGPDVVRRTAPVKVTIGLLYRELDAAKGDGSVTVDRALFESMITTLECAVEDIETRATPKLDERRIVNNEPAARIAAPRP